MRGCSLPLILPDQPPFHFPDFPSHSGKANAGLLSALLNHAYSHTFATGQTFLQVTEQVLTADAYRDSAPYRLVNEFSFAYSVLVIAFAIQQLMFFILHYHHKLTSRLEPPTVP